MRALRWQREPWRQLLASGLSLLVGLVGCSEHLPLARPAAPLTLPTRLCMVGESPPRCRAPQQIEALLAAGPKLLSMADTPSGSQGAKIDNSIAFLSIKNPMMLVREDWSHIQIPSIPQSLLERLKGLTVARLRALSSIVELEKRERQLLPSNPNVERIPSDGHAMSWQGSRLRIGLSNREIELVTARISQLLQRPEAAAAGP